MTDHSRPLSPFMHYRWQFSNGFSILHRLTGVWLSVGLLFLVYWVQALAAGPERYHAMQALYVRPVVQCALLLWLLSFFYHLLNGVRHLFWDAGYGFERQVARASGWAVFVGALLLTGLTWGVLLLRCGAYSSGVLV